MDIEIEALKQKILELEYENKILKKDNLELSKNKDLLSTALEQSPSGIIIADAPNVTITLANKEAIGIRGKSDNNLTNIDVSEHSIKWQTYYLNGEPYKPEDLPLSKAILKGEVVQGEKVIIRQNGLKDRIVSANAAPVKDKVGNIIAGMVVFHDITELEESKKELEKYYEKLESEVTIRTAQLKEVNEEYISLNEEYEANNEEIKQTNEELNLINERLIEEIDYRKKAEKELQDYKDHLENVVEDRTKQLVESEKKYRLIIQNLPSVAWKTSEQGVTDYISPNIQNIYGFTPNEIYTKGEKVWLGRIHPNDLENVFQNFSDLFKTGKKFDVEYRVKHKNGKWIWLHDVASVVTKEDDVRYAFGVFTDITERKIIQEKAREKEYMFKTLFESANDAIFIIEGEILINCNEKTPKMFKCKKEDIIGTTPYMFSPIKQPDGSNSKDKAIKVINDALKGENKRFEWRHCKFDGTEFDTEVSLSKIRIANKDYIQAIVRDVSERKKSEQALIESEEKFRNIFNNSIDTIVITDLKSKLLEVNESVLSKFGYTREELSNLKTLDIIAPIYLSKSKERVKMFHKGEMPPSIEIELIHKNGSHIPVEINGRLINYMGKKAILTVIRDISERKELERKIFDTMIETEEQERQRLAQDLHDDIGPLLSTLNLYIHGISEMEDENKRDELIQTSKAIIQESVASIRQISNALSPHILTSFGLVSAIDSRLDKIKELIKYDFDTNVSDTRFSPTIETIYYRVLNELINNTIKHAQATKIKINLTYSNNLLVFEYSDNGIGFDLEKKLKSKESGLGLKNILSRVNKIGGSYKMYKLKKGMAFFLSIEIVN